MALATLAPATATRGFAITPSDSTVFTTNRPRMIWVGGTGNVAVMMAGDTVAITFTAVPAGTMLPVNVTRVMAATTATLLIGLY
jgi:hypothetical protein